MPVLGASTPSSRLGRTVRWPISRAKTLGRSTYRRCPNPRRSHDGRSPPESQAGTLGQWPLRPAVSACQRSSTSKKSSFSDVQRLEHGGDFPFFGFAFDFGRFPSAPAPRRWGKKRKAERNGGSASDFALREPGRSRKSSPSRAGQARRQGHAGPFRRENFGFMA